MGCKQSSPVESSTGFFDPEGVGAIALQRLPRGGTDRNGDTRVRYSPLLSKCESEEDTAGEAQNSRVPLVSSAPGGAASSGGKRRAKRPPDVDVVDRAPGEQLDIVQFSTAIFYVEEAEGVVKLDIMRLGSMRGTCSILFQTEDGSATAPEKYIPLSGEVVFEDGEDQKTISVGIVDSSDWAATLEFKVSLHEPLDCEVGRYLHTCRIKIIDSNTFPSSKYEWELRHGQEGVDRISGFGLLIEFLRLMRSLEGNRWRTILILCLDQLQNLYLFYTLYVGAYLVNVVFADRDDSEARLFWQGGDSVYENRLMTATAIGAFYVIPMTVLHFWAYVRLHLDLRGRSRIWLQKSLFRKYLNYTEDSRIEVSASDMQTAVMLSADQLAEGYAAVVEMCQRMGKLFVMIYFVLMENPSVTWCVFVMPLLMLAWTSFRHCLVDGPEDSIPKRREVTNLVADTCCRYRLIANYFQRPRMNDIFSRQVTALRRIELPEETFELMNSYFFKWVGPVFMGAYIALQAHRVLDKDLELGTFLATISVFKDIASDFAAGHDDVMRVMDTLDPLRHYCVLLNAETDLLSWKVSNRSRRLATKEARRSVLDSGASEAGSGIGQGPGLPAAMAAVAGGKAFNGGGGGASFKTDSIPISLTGFSFSYARERNILFDVNLQVHQGKMISVSGRHGSGKATLLRLMGFELFPTAGEYFVPTHLRVLHVSQEAYLLKGSVWHNIAFGCARASDIDPDRVKLVLRSLGIWDSLEKHITHDLEGHREVLERRNFAMTDSEGYEADEVRGDGGIRSACCSSMCCGCGRAQPEDAGSQDNGSSMWQREVNYSTRLKIHLARALIMNPEVLVLNRPLHHFNEEEQAEVLKLLRDHTSNRGLHMPGGSVSQRRPRTLFYTAECIEHVMASDIAWTLHGTKVDEFNVEGSCDAHKEKFAASYAQLVRSSNRRLGANTQ